MEIPLVTLHEFPNLEIDPSGEALHSNCTNMRCLALVCQEQAKNRKVLTILM